MRIAPPNWGGPRGCCSGAPRGSGPGGGREPPPPALRFLAEHADRAAELGWTTELLFGVHPQVGAVRVDACGALMISGGRPVVSVEKDRIRFEANSYYRTLGA